MGLALEWLYMEALIAASWPVSNETEAESARSAVASPTMSYAM